MKRSIFLFLCVFVVVCACGASNKALAQRWEPLGERSASIAADHDSIGVTAAKGDFRAIKLTVRNAPIRFERLEVVYGNGVPEKIELRELIPAGGETRIIDLHGGERVIKRVDFWYETKSLGGKRASIRLFGRR